MTSHKKISGLEITLGKGGLRFKKRPSKFNICIGKHMKGKGGPVNGGRYDTHWHEEFTAAVQACR